MYGQNIRLFRKQKGMNQHELGAAMDVSAVSVSKWEREQTQPDIETLQKLADLFDTSIDELCGRPPKPEDAMDNMSVMCRAFRQMKPEEQEKYLAVGKALFASAFALAKQSASRSMFGSSPRCSRRCPSSCASVNRRRAGLPPSR